MPAQVSLTSVYGDHKLELKVKLKSLSNDPTGWVKTWFSPQYCFAKIENVGISLLHARFLLRQ